MSECESEYLGDGWWVMMMIMRGVRMRMYIAVYYAPPSHPFFDRFLPLVQRIRYLGLVLFTMAMGKSTGTVRKSGQSLLLSAFFFPFRPSYRRPGILNVRLALLFFLCFWTSERYRRPDKRAWQRARGLGLAWGS